MKYFLGNKRLQYYKDLLIKADLGLHEQVSERLLKLCPPPAKILDFGAGEGALSQRLVDLGYEVTATDKESDHFLCRGAKFHQLNFNEDEEINRFVESHCELFDVVLGIEVIEHVENPWQYIRRLKDMVKQDGHILITTPNITSWLSRILFFFTGQFHQFNNADLGYGHISPISAWQLQAIMDGVGLKDIVIRSAGTLPPIYLTGWNSLSFLNLIILPLRMKMRGIKDGWCVMAEGRKP